MHIFHSDYIATHICSAVQDISPLEQGAPHKVSRHWLAAACYTSAFFFSRLFHSADT